MTTATAQLNNYRQSPRKVRVVAGLTRGKSVPQAIVALEFAGKKAALPLRKLIESAVSNAKNAGMDVDKLIVSKITVDAGKTLFRSLPMSRGRAFRMKKRTCAVFVELAEKADKPAKAAKAEKASAAAAAPKAKKAPAKKAAEKAEAKIS